MGVMAFMSEEQARAIGFKHLGRGCRISDKTCFYGVDRIEIGDNSRIDDFCLISAGEKGIKMGRHVHVACYVSLIGYELIQLDDFVGVSAKTAVYSSTDDYSGEYLTNPTVPEEFKNVIHGAVVLEKHVLVGAGCVLLPGIKLGLGCCVGA